MKLLLIFILCSAFIAFKPEMVAESIVRRPERVQAAAVVQTANNSGTSTSISITLSSTSANNLVVVSIFMSSSTSISTVTDNQGSTYTISSSVTEGSSTLKGYQAYAIVSAGVTSVTITRTGSAGTALGGCADEYSGTATSSVSDVSGSGSGTGTSLSVSITPSASGKLIVASLFGYLANGWTAGSDYTLYGNSNYAGSYPIVRSQYRLSGTT